jgi:two-component system KDP operon response regulator KdpE
MKPEPLVLAIGDEMGFLRLMELELSAQGFRLLTASTGEEALRLAEEQRPDILLIHILMPGMTGLEVLHRLREQMSIPVIMVTARDSDAEKVRGLEMEADDYIFKPFNAEELVARIRAVLRRTVSPRGAERLIRAGDVEIDLNRKLVTKGGEPLRFTRTEWLLLQYLAANAGRVMLNAELLANVWGPEHADDLQYLRVWVSRLRRKLEANPSEPQIIKTMQGIGYMLDGELVAPSTAAAQR